MENLKQAVVSALKILNPNGRTVDSIKPTKPSSLEKHGKFDAKFTRSSR